VATALELLRGLHRHAGAGQGLDQAIEPIDDESRVRFASGTEVGIDAEVDLDSARLEPAAAAPGKVVGLGDAGNPQQRLIEGGSSRLLARWHGELDMVEGANRHRPIVTKAARRVVPHTVSGSRFDKLSFTFVRLAFPELDAPAAPERRAR
jgi:hypothetical protein